MAAFAQEGETMKNPKVGQRVKIDSKHWLRGDQIGVVIAENGDRRSGDYSYIQFEKKYPGGGIDGDKLRIANHFLFPAE